MTHIKDSSKLTTEELKNKQRRNWVGAVIHFVNPYDDSAHRCLHNKISKDNEECTAT